MQLNCLAFNQNGFKSLNAQAVQSWSTVQHNRVLFDHFFKNVPNYGRTGFNFLFRSLDGGCYAHCLQAGKNERLEQFQRHQLRQAALMKLEGWAHNDD